MGIPSELRDMWRGTNEKVCSFLLRMNNRRCRGKANVPLKGVRVGFKVASIACAAIDVPTLAAVRLIPWAKANLNHTGQALVLSTASIAAFFITADKAILECARKNSQQLEEALK